MMRNWPLWTVDRFDFLTESVAFFTAAVAPKKKEKKRKKEEQNEKEDSK